MNAPGVSETVAPVSSGGRDPEVPTWFTAALAAPVETGAVDVAGTPISFRVWGDPAGAGAGVLLVHGGAAHARWWDHVAPLLAIGRRVVAIDLSGHGDSGRRPAYSFPMWSAEACAVMEGTGLGDRPVLVGHSMGGFVALGAAHDRGGRVGGVITVDAPHHMSSDERIDDRKASSFAAPAGHRDRAALVARFRALPRQRSLPYAEAHVAEHSVVAGADGWRWKFDPAFAVVADAADRIPAALECPVTMLIAEHGLVGLAAAAELAGHLPAPVAVVELPDAGHAPMLDRPLSLVAALRTQLANWAASDHVAGGRT